MGKGKNRQTAAISPAMEAALERHPSPEDTIIGDASELEEKVADVATPAPATVAKPRGRTSSNPTRAVKVTFGEQEFEYRKPGKPGVVLADLKYIASHTTPSLILTPVGEEYEVS